MISYFGSCQTSEVGQPRCRCCHDQPVPIVGAAAANNSANCFDLSVLRETPTYDLPRSCGGTKPD